MDTLLRQKAKDAGQTDEISEIIGFPTAGDSDAVTHEERASPEPHIDLPAVAADPEILGSYLPEKVLPSHLSRLEVPVDEKLMAPRGDLFDNDDHSYLAARLDGQLFQPDPDMFYSEDYIPSLSAMVDFVIDAEGPIHEDVLVRRIARHHGFQRAGRQIHDIVVNIAKNRRGRTQEDVGLFFWRKGTVKNRVAPARYKDRDNEMRKVEYICAEEIRAIKTLLSLNADPIEMARHIGIARLTKSTRGRLSKALETHCETQFDSSAA